MKSFMHAIAFMLMITALIIPCTAQDKGTIAPDQIPGAAVYIPYPIKITLDGKLDDWKGVPVQRVSKGPQISPVKSQNQFIDFAIAADEEYLYVRLESTDSKIISGKHKKDFWNEDSMEFYVNFSNNLKRSAYDNKVMQITFSPINFGVPADQITLSGTNCTLSKARGYVFKTKDGWAVEAAVPYSSYFKAEHGKTIGFQVHANGATEKDRNSKLIWSSYDIGDSSYRDPSVFGRGVFFKVGSKDIPVPANMSLTLAETFKAEKATGKKGRKIVWQDEFDYTGETDQKKWAYDAPDCGKYNQELQIYTSDRANSFVQDGNLTIRAIKDKNGKWSSARLFTKGRKNWTYGYVEVRAKLPAGKGTWPAIWMMPEKDNYGPWPDSGEIDIMEFVGFSPDVIHTSVHTAAYNHRIATQKTRSSTVKGVSDGFHTYALEWTPKGLFWYVDDEPYFYFLNEGKKDFKTWPFDKPFHLILNVAMGGTWGGQNGMDPAISTADMVVDYVRLYQ